MVDSTWVTPWITKPLELGADMVMHSVTKYLGGHSDMTGGCVVAAEHLCSEDGFFKKVRHSQTFVGGGLAPFDCWLCMFGSNLSMMSAGLLLLLSLSVPFSSIHIKCIGLGINVCVLACLSDECFCYHDVPTNVCMYTLVIPPLFLLH